MSSTTKEQKLQSLIEMERMLNEIQDLDVLLERILTEARKIVHADAGSIYVVEGNNLRIKYAQNDTQLKTVPAGSKIPSVALAIPIEKKLIAGYCVVSGEPVNIADAYNLSEDVPFSFNRATDEETGYRSTSMFCIPLKIASGKILGVLQIINAQDENGNQGENITLGENDVTTLKNYKVKAYTDSDGYQTVKSGSESGFAINAKNVAEVTFESEKGTFSYYDMLLQSKLIDEGKYYVEIPLTDEENKLYHDKYENKDREFYNYLSKHKDLSKYFNGKSQNAEDYGIYYSDKNDYKNENQLLLAPKKYCDEFAKSDSKKITVKTYRDGDKIQDVYYSADDAIDALIKNPNLKYEDLPSDTITITVKFKDGQTATKKIKTSFNSKGQLQLQYVK